MYNIYIYIYLIHIYIYIHKYKGIYIYIYIYTHTKTCCNFGSQSLTKHTLFYTHTQTHMYQALAQAHECIQTRNHSAGAERTAFHRACTST